MGGRINVILIGENIVQGGIEDAGLRRTQTQESWSFVSLGEYSSHSLRPEEVPLLVLLKKYRELECNLRKAEPRQATGWESSSGEQMIRSPLLSSVD